MGATWAGSSHGVRWELTLERDRLLPGRLVAGTVDVTADDRFEARSLDVALVATEWWQHEESSTDGQGHTTTHTETTRQVLVREPVRVSEAIVLAAGETRRFDVQLPVPPLGPASLEATVAGLAWVVEAKLERPGWPDSRLEAPVQVVQPVALLRAGVVPVGEFALYPAADAGDPGLTASIALDPMPLIAGSPFRGTIRLRSDAPRRLQEVRAEVRVEVEATAPRGLSETVIAWAGTVVGPTDIQGERELAFEGTLSATPLPTIELPHGKARAVFHLILATAWARDPHLTRDVTIATTSEL